MNLEAMSDLSAAIIARLTFGSLSTEEIAKHFALPCFDALRFCRILERSELVVRDLRFLPNGDAVAVWAIA